MNLGLDLSSDPMSLKADENKNDVIIMLRRKQRHFGITALKTKIKGSSAFFRQSGKSKRWGLNFLMAASSVLEHYHLHSSFHEESRLMCTILYFWSLYKTRISRISMPCTIFVGSVYSYYFDVFILYKFRHIYLLSLQTKELLKEAKHTFICKFV